MPDVEIRCVHCRQIFLFSEREQEIYYSRNMMQPQRCPACRPTRKKQENGQKQQGRYDIVCDRCGKPDQVPFAPKLGRTVLCKNCYGASGMRARVQQKC